MTYTPPLRDIRFTFEHVAGLDGLTKLEDLTHADLDDRWTSSPSSAASASTSSSP